MDSNELYSDFREAVSKLVDNVTSSNSKDQLQNVDHVIETLEAILKHGFNSNQTIFSRGNTVWEFIEPRAAKDLVENVLALTEGNPTSRTRTFLLITLMQQSTFKILDVAYNELERLQHWYDETAFMMQPDKRESVLGLLKGLATLEINVFVPESSKNQLSSIADVGIHIGLSSLSATVNTFEKVQKTVVKKASQSLLKVGALLDGSANAPSELASLKESNTRLEQQLNSQRESVGRLNVELVSVKMQTDKEIRRLKQEVARLESLLEFHNIPYEKNT